MIEKELTVEARDEQLAVVQDFVQELLDSAGVSLKAQMQISIAVEEIFVNISHYAYTPNIGSATIRIRITENPPELMMIFRDRGIPYDPTKAESPDLSLPAAEREVGGLGIYMTKQLVDKVSYEYRDGQNILTLLRRL
jgi:anti-sigma regulatory factor (Ser/Thr protein kinase)